MPVMRKAGLACGLIALAALAASPGAAQQPPLALHIHSERAMFQVLISPGHVGIDSFVLQLMSGDGDRLPAKEAALTLSLPGRGIAPPARKATLGGDGYWHVTDVPIPQPGRWHLRIDVRTADQNITLEDDIEVPAR
jgi:copper transport protein